MKSVSWDGRAVQPSKIVCIGRNYAAHIAELGNEIPDEPVFFLKPNSAISSEVHSNPEQPIHYEGEITFLVSGGQLRAVGFGLDLTKRALQTRLKSKGLPWERAKAFDKSAVFSEFVTFEGHIGALRLELHINGDLIQAGGCSLMLHKPAGILAEAGRFLTLEDGDLVMTGTPSGVGEVHAGDRMNGRIFEGERLLVEANWTVR